MVDDYAACQGKSCFESRKQANKAVKRILRRGVSRRATPKKQMHLKPYVCGDCGQWHIGNERKPFKPRRRL